MDKERIIIIEKAARKRGTEPACGMHPGGGFVAWPDGESPAPSEKEQPLPGGIRDRRKMFIAWPEEEKATSLKDPNV